MFLSFIVAKGTAVKDLQQVCAAITIFVLNVKVSANDYFEERTGNGNTIYSVKK